MSAARIPAPRPDLHAAHPDVEPLLLDTLAHLADEYGASGVVGMAHELWPGARSSPSPDPAAAVPLRAGTVDLGPSRIRYDYAPLNAAPAPESGEPVERWRYDALLAELAGALAERDALAARLAVDRRPKPEPQVERVPWGSHLRGRFVPYEPDDPIIRIWNTHGIERYGGEHWEASVCSGTVGVPCDGLVEVLVEDGES